MCGITGHFSKLNNVNKQECLQMSDAIKHRGPDSFGGYFANKIFLGHRRLAIIDLSETGHQPMWDSEKKIGIIFNGEIYNYKEIKKELTEFHFFSTSDTEVIIYAYKKWGIEKTIEKLNGMFSFCIYDKHKNQAYFVRDRIGIKPFVYFFDKENFIFASELKAILKNKVINKKINKKAVADYFIHRYVPNPNTIFEGINKLEPGHFLKLDLQTFDIKKTQYWKLNNKRYLHLSENEIIEKAEKLINIAVKYRLIADTEIASFLSGGIDSSLITSIAKKIIPKLKAFTIDLHPEKYSELNFAETAAKYINIKLISETVKAKSFQENFDKIISFYDEPFADSSLVPTFLLTKIVSEAGIKCALSGDGGDEVFYGYNWYSTFNKVSKAKNILNIFPKKIVQKLLSFINNETLSLVLLNSIETYRKILYNRFTVAEINKLFNYNLIFKETDFFKEKIKKENIKLPDLSFIDFQTFMIDDILYKVDIASMANSLEVRVPFLDHNIIEFMFSVSFKYLFKNKELKHILKEISKTHIPKKNIYRKKKGFSAPVMEWIHKDFDNELIAGNLVKHKIITFKNMQEFLQNENSHGKIWQMYVFEKWFSNYFL